MKNQANISKEEEECIIDDFEEAFSITLLSKKYSRGCATVSKILIQKYGIDKYKRLVAEHFRKRNPIPKIIIISEEEKNDIVKSFVIDNFSTRKLERKYKHDFNILAHILVERLGEDGYRDVVKKHKSATFLNLNKYKRVEITKEEGENILQSFLMPNADFDMILKKYHHSFAKIKNFLIGELGEKRYTELLTIHRCYSRPNSENENNPNWKGGVSSEPYCILFNKEFKERVREFFGRQCFECNKTEKENGRKLDVHHINYDKMVCCNDVIPLFAALCHGCNGKANGNRKYWEEHFTQKIMKEFNGKCFYTKEEMNEIKNDKNE